MWAHNNINTKVVKVEILVTNRSHSGIVIRGFWSHSGVISSYLAGNENNEEMSKWFFHRKPYPDAVCACFGFPRKKLNPSDAITYKTSFVYNSSTHRFFKQTMFSFIISTINEQTEFLWRLYFTWLICKSFCKGLLLKNLGQQTHQFLLCYPIWQQSVSEQLI